MEWKNYYHIKNKNLIGYGLKEMFFSDGVTRNSMVTERIQRASRIIHKSVVTVRIEFMKFYVKNCQYLYDIFVI